VAGRRRTPVEPRLRDDEDRSDYWVRIKGGATIHRGECSFCLVGRGGYGRTKPLGPTSVWFGPFGSVGAGHAYAVSTGQLLIRRCRRCKP
jgi:hypothetical protein